MMQSIERKENRIKNLEWSINQTAFEKEVKLLRVAKKALEEEVEQDKKLILTEEEDIKSAYEEGVYLAMQPSKTSQDYYNQTYGNHEQ